MLRKIEYLIPAALNAVSTVLENNYGKDKIPSGYQSAISGFGTSLLQMGLMPTLAIYTDKDNEAGIDRSLLLKTLFTIILDPTSKLSDPQKNKLPTDAQGNIEVDKLLKEVANLPFKKVLKEHLMQAALAFKLAIRTYQLKKQHD